MFHHSSSTYVSCLISHVRIPLGFITALLVIIIMHMFGLFFLVYFFYPARENFICLPRIIWTLLVFPVSHSATTEFVSLYEDNQDGHWAYRLSLGISWRKVSNASDNYSTGQAKKAGLLGYGMNPQINGRICMLRHPCHGMIPESDLVPSCCCTLFLQALPVRAVIAEYDFPRFLTKKKKKKDKEAKICTKSGKF